MKKILVLIIVITLTSTITLGQEMKPVPPGTIYLNDRLYIDKVPITNKMFLEYLTAKHFLRKKGFISFYDFHRSTEEKFDRLITLYPSFLKNLNKNTSLLTKKKYFEDLKYQNSPVLNISKEQSVDYCKWRSEMVNYLWANKSKPINQNLKYRLPQENEIKIAKEQFSKKERFRFYDGKNPTKFNNYKDTNNFVMYNISEFTISDKIFGNNWKNASPTEFPNEVTGFRCVCEILP